MQEFLFHRLRRGDRDTAAAQAASDLRTTLRLHDFDREVLDRAISLVATTAIRGRDAVHAATALGAGFTEIVSADTEFDAISSLERIDPANVQFNQS